MPGYAGYIPSIKADNLHAKGYSPITKQSFSNSRLGTNVHGLATTGFNVDKKVFVDGSLLASSSKFGKTALQMPHPAWRV